MVTLFCSKGGNIFLIFSKRAADTLEAGQLSSNGGIEMARTLVFVVSDDHEMTDKAKSFGQSNGCTVKSYTQGEWLRGMNDPAFRMHLTGEIPALTVGSSPLEEGAKILPFPSMSHGNHEVHGDKKVRTINELESLAIENAIHEYSGNLTEAARALGIGRATLYRKVKQYNIDPSQARRKRAA
jgi:hypothetical protein